MTDCNLSNLGKQIRKARIECQLTQAELADQTGVGVKSIQNIERGTVNPSYVILYSLIERLGIPANTLFNQDVSDQDEVHQKLILIYESCTPEHQQLLLNILNDFAQANLLKKQ